MEQNFDFKELARIIADKHTEVVENTIFELVQVAGCNCISELQNKGYEIRREYRGQITTIGLYYHKNHVITYSIYIENQDNSLKVKRERKINNLEGGELCYLPS